MEKRVLLWEKAAVKEKRQGKLREERRRGEQMQNRLGASLFFPETSETEKVSAPPPTPTPRPWRPFLGETDWRAANLETLRDSQGFKSKLSRIRLESSHLNTFSIFFPPRRLNVTDQSAHRWATRAAAGWMLQWKLFCPNKRHKNTFYPVASIWASSLCVDRKMPQDSSDLLALLCHRLSTGGGAFHTHVFSVF